MERCLGGLNLKICLVYLDDVIVFGSTFEETLERLQTADITLTTLGTTLNPSASAFTPATGAEVPQEGPPPTNGSIDCAIEPSAHSKDGVAAVHTQGSHPSCDRAVDLHENHPPELARQTRSGRISRPPNRLICDPVWSHKAAALLSLVTPANRTVVQNVFLAWLGDT